MCSSDLHDDGDVLAFGRGGDDDFFTSGGDVALGFIGLGEETGGFDHEVDPQLFPWEGGGAFLHGETFDFVSVDHEDVVLRHGGGRFGAGDVEVKTALGGIVFDEVGEVVCGYKVVDGDHLKFGSEESLLAESPENQSAYPTESINCDFVFGSHRFKTKNIAKKEGPSQWGGRIGLGSR